DHRGPEEGGRVRAGREQIAPAPRAGPDADDGEERAGERPAPVGVRESDAERAEIDLPEQRGEEGEADADAGRDLQQAHSEAELREDGAELRGHRGGSRGR